MKILLVAAMSGLLTFVPVHHWRFTCQPVYVGHAQRWQYECPTIYVGK